MNGYSIPHDQQQEYSEINGAPFAMLENKLHENINIDKQELSLRFLLEMEIFCGWVRLNAAI